MNFETFTKNAIRTESTITSVNLDPTMLTQVLHIGALTGQLVNLYKRHIYYVEPFNYAKFNDLILQLHSIVIPLMQGTPDVSSKQSLNVDPRILHATLGAFTESGELLELTNNYIETGKLDVVNLGEEFADINWYQAIGYDSAGLSFEHILDVLINKLKVRFPDKFDSGRALNRDIEAERKQLEM